MEDITSSSGVQDAIVEATLFALSNRNDSALRGTIIALKTLSRRRLSHDLESTGVSAIVKVGFTMEDFTFKTVDEAMTSFGSTLTDNFNSGAFDAELKTQVNVRAPKSAVTFSSVSSLASTLSDPQQFVTIDVPTARPTFTPAPTRAPSTCEI